ncbi:hypothetical protein CSE16_03685 [Solibacillus sp. R5-41]|uniref:hypothetical protein n=1 Tax=Solibacillus sp. R5-41 TaxID=2048654 RepID=UPI000C125D2E|nr:hypothetical protein [Solibacillus sp. R5-41]ATP39204.1 hypothetical protein CSE16_03685 [Solibacillus sp. R5-41]
MALLILVVVNSFVFLIYHFIIIFLPFETADGIPFAGGFMVVFLAFHTNIIFVLGVIFNVFTFNCNELKGEKVYLISPIFNQILELKNAETLLN